MIKVLRPFWSFDVADTEKWLLGMSEKGYQLVKFNRWTHTFHFQKSASKTTTYRIVFDKVKNLSLSRSLSNEEWVKVSQSGNWHIFSNDRPFDLLKTSPVRDGVIQHNKKIMYLLSAILLYFTITAIMNITLISFQGDQVEVVESPWWLLTYSVLVIAIALSFIGVYAIIKIIKSNKGLQHEKNKSDVFSNRPEKSLTRKQERQWKQSGKIIVKRKFGWMYSPDKLEEWLEAMEELGYNLYRISKLGTTFYFIVSSPRKVSYCADYQNLADENYYHIHKDSGWHCMFRSLSSIQKWTIWAKEFSEGEEKPQIYSDRPQALKHAKRVALTYSALFLPIIILYFFLVGIFISDILNNRLLNLNLLNSFMYMLTILAFGSFTV
ncbi:DUF2812 domain-containing protein [Bacillus sp. JJ1122]|uniref:DUF2812 domain-containing protein n=1 Tax=Bacillus sp. JJ1122 TaxID=3122951 RepID=UPI002FFFF1C3